jgi:hypothetical protein
MKTLKTYGYWLENTKNSKTLWQNPLGLPGKVGMQNLFFVYFFLCLFFSMLG